MAKHEFGIMMNAPQQSERYDEYEPWKYDGISVDDKDLEDAVKRLTFVDSYWHTLSAKNKGLSSPFISEMICIFPYFCPYEIIVREIRESFI